MHKTTKRLLLVTTRQYNYLIKYKTTTTPTSAGGSSSSSSSFNDFLKHNHNQILIKNSNNSNSNNTTNNNNEQININRKYIKIYNEKQLINQRNQSLKDKVINEKINSNSSTERMISNVVYIVNDKKEITTKVYEANSNYDFLEVNRFHLDISIPKITLNSIYYKYAQMVKEEIDLETIKKEAKKDNILVSTSFYNTLIYVYILKLEKEKQKQVTNGGSGGQTNGMNEIESIYRYIYKPDRTTFLLKILSLAKNCDGGSVGNGESLREYVKELIKGPNSYLLCLDGFLMLIQTFYNLKNYRMVVAVYREFVHHHSFLNEDEHWYSGIIVHSMYQDRCSPEEILGVLNKSNLYYSKQTQFHFNCLAMKYIEENSVIDAWNILQKLYLNDLEYAYNLPIKIINSLMISEQRELTLKMYPLLMVIYKDASKSKRGLVRTLLESCGEQGTLILNNQSLLNPLSDDYILCKKSIESIQIDPTPSILGIKIPIVPKHQRITRHQRIFDKRLVLFANNQTDIKKDFFQDISNLGDQNTTNNNNNNSNNVD